MPAPAQASLFAPPAPTQAVTFTREGFHHLAREFARQAFELQAIANALCDAEGVFRTHAEAAAQDLGEACNALDRASRAIRF
jgi:hypothetical protein